jgi:hypothetical protein
MGRYFGREPRYSREEIERQAQEAIDARVSLGRPPEEDFRPLLERLSEVDRALAARPPIPPLPAPQPLRLTEVRLSQTQQADAPAPRPKAKQRPARRPVAARPTVN